MNQRRLLLFRSLICENSAPSTTENTFLNTVLRELCALNAHPEQQLSLCPPLYRAFIPLLPLSDARVARAVHQWKNSTQHSHSLATLHFHLLEYHANYHTDFRHFLATPRDFTRTLLESNNLHIAHAQHSLLESLVKLYDSNIHKDTLLNTLREAIVLNRVNWRAVATFLHMQRTIDSHLINAELHSLEVHACQKQTTPLLEGLLVIRRYLLSSHDYLDWLRALFQTLQSKQLRFLIATLQSLVPIDTLHYSKIHRAAVPRNDAKKYHKYFKVFVEQLIQFQNRSKPSHGTFTSLPPQLLAANQYNIHKELLSFERDQTSYIENVLNKEFKYNNHAFVSQFLPQLFTSELDKQEDVLRAALIKQLTTLGHISEDLLLSLSSVNQTDEAKENPPHTQQDQNRHANNKNADLQPQKSPVELLQEFQQKLTHTIPGGEQIEAHSADHFQGAFCSLRDLSEQCNGILDAQTIPPTLQKILSSFIAGINSENLHASPFSIRSWSIAFVQSTILHMPRLHVHLQKIVSAALTENGHVNSFISYSVCHLLTTFIHFGDDLHNLIQKVFENVQFQNLRNMETFMRCVNTTFQLAGQYRVRMDKVPLLMLQLMEWLCKRLRFLSSSEHSEYNSINVQKRLWEGLLQKHVSLATLCAQYSLVSLQKWIQMEVCISNENKSLQSQSAWESYVSSVLFEYYNSVYGSQSSIFAKDLFMTWCFCVKDGVNKDDTKDDRFQTHIITQIRLFLDALTDERSNVIGSEVSLSPFFALVSRQCKQLLEEGSPERVHGALTKCFQIVDDSSYRRAHFVSDSAQMEHNSHIEYLAPVLEGVNTLFSSLPVWPNAMIRYFLDNVHKSQKVALTVLSACPFFALQIILQWEKHALFLQHLRINHRNATGGETPFNVLSSLRECLESIFAITMNDGHLCAFKSAIAMFPSVFGLLLVHCSLFLLSNQEGYHGIRQRLSHLDHSQLCQFVQSRTMYLIMIATDQCANWFLVYTFYAAFCWSLPFISSEIRGFSSFCPPVGGGSQEAQQLLDEVQTTILSIYPHLLLLIKNDVSENTERWIELISKMLPKVEDDIPSALNEFFREDGKTIGSIDEVVTHQHTHQTKWLKHDVLKPHLVYWTKKHHSSGFPSSSCSTSSRHSNATGSHGTDDVGVILVHFFKIVASICRDPPMKGEWEGRMSNDTRRAFHEMVQAFEEHEQGGVTISTMTSDPTSGGEVSAVALIRGKLAHGNSFRW